MIIWTCCDGARYTTGMRHDWDCPLHPRHQQVQQVVIDHYCAAKDEELRRLRAALTAIKDAPGGGPGRRIAMMALGETAAHEASRKETKP